MKKIILFVTLLVLISSYAFAGSLAAGTVSAPGAAIYGGVVGAAAAAPTPLIRFSTGVRGVVFVNTTVDYLLGTKHDSGSKLFATANSVTNIYWHQSAAGAADATMWSAAGVGNYQTSNLVGNGWTSY